MKPARMRWLLLPALAGASVACMQNPLPAATPAPPAAADAALPAGCLATGDGRLEATLRGALEADLQWSNAQMECDGGLRPDGKGLRVAIAGPMQAARNASAGPGRLGTAGVARRLQFIFGIDLTDTATGPAQVLPTNLTVIVEGEGLLYATRGADKCAVEDLERVPLADGQERVTVRGYCLGPASDLAGGTRLHVPTFSFTALTHSVEDDAASVAQ
jgi:hypothetical protein